MKSFYLLIVDNILSISSGQIGILSSLGFKSKVNHFIY